MSRFAFHVALLSLVDETMRPLEAFIGAHLQWLKENGADGVLVMGTTGEFASFSVSQRQYYLETLLTHNPGLKVMVNIGASAMADVFALQAHAVSQPGVDSILWMPPFYYPDAMINGLAESLEAILANQPEQIPLLAYHYPKTSQVSITPAMLEAFPRLAGLKDTSGDFERLALLRRELPRKLLYVGTDDAVQASMALGCTGVISGMGNIVPQLFSQSIDGSASAQEKLFAIKAQLPNRGKIPALKAYLNQLHLAPQRSVSALPHRDMAPAEAQVFFHHMNQVVKAEPQTYAT